MTNTSVDLLDGNCTAYFCSRTSWHFVRRVFWVIIQRALKLTQGITASWRTTTFRSTSRWYLSWYISAVELTRLTAESRRSLTLVRKSADWRGSGLTSQRAVKSAIYSLAWNSGVKSKRERDWRFKTHGLNASDARLKKCRTTEHVQESIRTNQNKLKVTEEEGQRSRG